jgi:hypothetical protein
MAMAEDAINCDWEPQPQSADEDQSLVSAAQRDPEAAGRLYDRYYGEHDQVPTAPRIGAVAGNPGALGDSAEIMGTETRAPM